MKCVIIDDNPGDRRLLEIHLQGMNPLKKCNCVHFGYLEDFKQWYQSDGECDIILLDLTLPDCDGLDTVESVASIVHDTPIVIMTGNSDLSMGEASLRVGAADYLVKDFINPALLEKTILFAIERNKNRYILKHHKAFLEALRSIDKKMQEDIAVHALFDFICQALMKVGSYDAIWILQNGRFTTEVSFHGNCAFAELPDDSEKAAHTCYVAQAIEEKLKECECIVEKDYHNTCTSCPLGLDHGNAGYMALPLRSEAETYGSLTIIGSRELIELDSEQLLFQELAKSISQMLYTRELQHREEELDQLRTRLHEFERLETLGRIAGGMAHDFNNQLTSILGNSELLQLELQDKPELQENIKEIISAVETSAELARDVLQFSRTQKKELGDCNLHQVIDDTAKLIRSTLPKTIHLQVEYNIEESIILGHSNKIENALLNLALNSADAMEQVGRITIQVEREDIAVGNHLCELFDIRPGAYISISVTDSGTGIPEELREQIFSPFFTTKSADKGTGLGLASVLSMVREHKGALEFTSEVGVGTTFTIYLSRKGEQVEEVASEQGTLVSGCGHILLVDDEKSVREMVTKLLKHLGYEVADFSYAEEALVLLENSDTHFDLIMSDYDMPDMNGIDFLLQFAAKQPGAKAILMTGHNIVNIGKIQSQSSLELKVLQKPFRGAQLSQAIGELLQ